MNQERSAFIKNIPASREAVEKLDRYETLLAEWNQKFNLVAPSTLPHIWSRHFLDSAQLFPMIPAGASLADLGSGAGFPGLVLSLMGISKVRLIESTGKKADFLRTVSEALGLDAIVHQCRIEDLVDFRADVLTARALASLKDTFPLAVRIIHKNSLCLFLKGQKADAELTEARKCWMFDCVKTPSLSDPSGTVLTIRNLRYDVQRKPKFSRRG